MTWLLINHRVRDYGTWKPCFDRDRAEQKKGGARGGYVMRDPQDPNRVSVALSFDDGNAAHAFAEAPRLKKAMAEAGVEGQPEVHYFDVIEEVSL